MILAFSCRFFLTWFLKKGRSREQRKKVLRSLGSWIDPLPLLPLVRTIVMFKLWAACMVALSNTNTLVLENMCFVERFVGVRKVSKVSRS